MIEKIKEERGKKELTQWYEKEYKEVDNLLGRSRWSRYYVDTDGYIYNNLSITSRIKQKETEINWLKEELKKVLGEEQYQTQIEEKYPYKFK